MADRFWVGGSGNINDAANHWAATSGGAPGAGNLPTVADNAIFDAASGANATITLNATLLCRDFDMGACAATPTLTGNGQISCAGNFTYRAGTILTAAFGTILLNANSPVVQQIKTNGVVITQQFNFQGTGTRQLADDLSQVGQFGFTATAGIFDANGKTVTFTSTNVCAITGALTFFNLNLISFSTKTGAFSFSANIAVTGTFKYQGNSAVNRLWIQSSVIGTPRTITAAAIDPTSGNCDFMDIGAAGAAAPFATGTLGDCGGNAGITFAPSATQFAKSGVSFNWSDATKWFLGTNGTGGAGRVPLPQDDVIFDASSITAAGVTVTNDMPRLGRNLTITNVANNPTFNFGGVACGVFGSLTLGGIFNWSSTGRTTMYGRGISTLTSAGKTFGIVDFDGPGGTFNLQDALTLTSVGTGSALNHGRLNTNGFTVTVPVRFSVLNDATLDMGASLFLINFIGSGTANWVISTTCTIIPGTSTIKFASEGSGLLIFSGAGKIYNNFWFSGGGTSVLQMVGQNTFNQFKIDPKRTINFSAAPANTTTAADWQIGNGVTIDSITAAAHTLAKSGGGKVDVNGATITNSTASPAATFFAHGSVDGGGNTAWTFPPARYWVGGTGNWSDAANHWAATSGGAPGAGNLPTAATDAIFNAASNATAYTVTLDAVVKNCLDLIFGAPATGAVTVAGTVNVNIFGSLSIAAAGVTPSAAATLIFSATAGVKTITTNGVAVQFGFNFFGVGGTSQLSDDLNCNGNTFQVGGGTFDPNGKTVTLLTQQGSIVMAGNIPFYNLTLTNRAQKTDFISLAGNLTVSHVFKYRGNSGVNRLLLQSNVLGTPRTITAAALDAASDFVDFQDIAGAGAAAPFAIGTTLGDALGNSGITFTPSLAQTAAPAGTASFVWSDLTKWSGGRVPLPQDDVTISNAFIAGRTITLDMPRAARNITFACSGNPAFSITQSTLFGSLTMAAGMTTAGAQGLYFGARGPVTLRSNGVALSFSIRTGQAVAGLNNTLTLLDPLNSPNTLVIGATNTFNDGGFGVTLTAVLFAAATASLVTNSVWTITGTGTAFNNGSAGPVLAGSASLIVFTDATAAVKNFVGGGKVYKNVWFAGVGTGAYQIAGSNTFAQFKADANRVLQFTAGTNTTAADWQIGTGATISSITAAGHTLTKTGGGRVLVDHATISNSNALPAVGTWKAIYSTDGGGNTGWDFELSAAIYSWPMMFVGTGVPDAWVNTDAGNVVGLLNGGAGNADAWTDNPALCLRDFLVNRAGLVVDDAYTLTAAQRCDELVTGAGGTEKRARMTLALTEKRPVRDWIETMRAYVPAWVVDSGAGWRIVADMPRAVDHYFGAGTIDSQPPPTLTRTGTRDTPNSVDVQFTDERETPWQTYTATAELAGVAEVRRTSVSLPGIRRFSQAKRFAIERLNHYTLEDTVGRMSIFDYGLRVLAGDVAQVSESAFGWSGREVRILAVDDGGNGRWNLEFREYDPAAYSDEVQIATAIPETGLTSPLTVIPPADFSVVEVLSAESNIGANGIGTGIIYQSRARVTFSESIDPYLDHYQILIYNDPANPIVDRIERGPMRWLSPTLQQLTTYNVEARAVNTLGVVSPTVSATLFIDGKQFPPGDVPAITQAFEVGGEVLLTWEPARDFDTLRYEWRVDLGNAGLTWEAMRLVDSVDGLRARFRGMPEGTHRFCVRALDSVGNYSVNSRCALITVTSDTGAFVQDLVFVAPTLTNMVLLKSPFDMDESASLRPRWITSSAATSWDATMPSPVDAGALPVFAYGRGAVVSSWRGEVQDVGSSIAGDFAITARITAYVGAARSYIEHSLDNVTWFSEDVTGGLSWRGEARFLRPFFQATAAGDSFLIEGSPRIGISASEGKEGGGPVLSSASLPTRINLTGRYSKLTQITVTPVGSASRDYTVDNVIVGAGVANHFDVYLWDAAGFQVADNFYWTIGGV